MTRMPPTDIKEQQQQQEQKHPEKATVLDSFFVRSGGPSWEEIEEIRAEVRSLRSEPLTSSLCNSADLLGSISTRSFTSIAETETECYLEMEKSLMSLFTAQQIRPSSSGICLSTQESGSAHTLEFIPKISSTISEALSQPVKSFPTDFSIYQVSREDKFADGSKNKQTGPHEDASERATAGSDPSQLMAVVPYSAGSHTSNEEKEENEDIEKDSTQVTIIINREKSDNTSGQQERSIRVLRNRSETRMNQYQDKVVLKIKILGIGTGTSRREQGVQSERTAVQIRPPVVDKASQSTSAEIKPIPALVNEPSEETYTKTKPTQSSSDVTSKRTIKSDKPSVSWHDATSKVICTKTEPAQSQSEVTNKPISVRSTKSSSSCGSTEVCKKIQKDKSISNKEDTSIETKLVPAASKEPSGTSIKTEQPSLSSSGGISKTNKSSTLSKVSSSSAVAERQTYEERLDGLRGVWGTLYEIATERFPESVRGSEEDVHKQVIDYVIGHEKKPRSSGLLSRWSSSRMRAGPSASASASASAGAVTRAAARVAAKAERVAATAARVAEVCEGPVCAVDSAPPPPPPPPPCQCHPPPCATATTAPQSASVARSPSGPPWQQQRSRPRPALPGPRPFTNRYVEALIIAMLVWVIVSLFFTGKAEKIN